MLIVNDAAVADRRKELTEFKGYLPFQFSNLISLSKRNAYLKSIGLFEAVQRENQKVMAGLRESPNEVEYMNSILKKWIIDNPEFKDMVIDVG